MMETEHNIEDLEDGEIEDDDDDEMVIFIITLYYVLA
jgi:hypothetical protein